MNDPTTTVYHCGAACDAAGLSLREAAIAVRGGVIVDVGEVGAVKGDKIVDLPDRVIMPAMVNAHAHLELTTIGPQPYGGDFVGWIRMLQAQRQRDEAGVRTSASRGAAMCESAGVMAIGDVGGSRFGCGSIIDVLRASRLGGVSFPEFLALGGDILQGELDRLDQTVSRPHDAEGVRLGLQPHAPYSTSPVVYQACSDAAVKHHLPISTHLAELKEEHQFVAEATGPFRDFVESIGVWSDDLLQYYGQGLSPVQWMKPYLQQTHWLLAHCNYVSDDDINTLASSGASVAYCPVASEYFGHRDHRYRDMLDAGVNVCLGTDSIVCQQPGDLQPLGILNQMRRLHARDATDPAQLLAMATTHGCRALGLDETEATLAVGSAARLIAVKFDVNGDDSPLTQVLRNRYPVEVIV